MGSCISDPLLILLPAYNNYELLAQTLDALDGELETLGRMASVLIVDDASTQPFPADPFPAGFSQIITLSVLRLKFHLGLQRAVVVGLSYAQTQMTFNAVIVMGSDGSDRSADAGELLRAFDSSTGAAVLFIDYPGHRGVLGAGVFRRCFRLVSRLLTGSGLRLGIFSILPAEVVKRLIAVGQLWGGYQAAMFRFGVDVKTLSGKRGAAPGGCRRRSQSEVLIEALRALCVFRERLGLIGVCLSGAAGVAAIALHLVTPCGLGSLLAVLIAAAAAFAAAAAGSWGLPSVLPARDYKYFVLEVLQFDRSA